MAILLTGSTIDSQTALHAGNIGSYAITSLTGYATQQWVNDQIATLTTGAPELLNTLDELAAAINDDANFAATITNQIGGKLSLAGGTLSGDVKILYDDHSTGLGWDTLLYIGKSDTLGLQGAFPTYVPAGSYGFFSHANSDGMFVGSVPVSAGASNYYATIAWGDDATEYLQFLYKGAQVARLDTVGRFYANGGNSDQWNAAYGWGNHADEGYLTSLPSHSHDDRYYTESEIDSKLLDYTPWQSGSDFVDGTLVRTSINASGTNGDSFLLQVRGKSYRTDESPYDLVLQGYLYNNTIISASAINNGTYFPTPVKVMELDGILAFWWPRGSYWNSFSVMCTQVSSADSRPENRVTSISNSAEPDSSKKISVEPYHSWSTKDFSSGSVSNWNTAYGWGNHANAGYLTGLPSHNHDDRYYTETESDDRFMKLDFDVITNANGNTSSNGTWANYGNNTAWGNYKVGDDSTAGATYNDGSGWIEYEVPAGMSTCYFGQLRWDSGGYFDVYAKKSDGSLIHRGRFISKNVVENNNHGGDHDGQQILKVSGFDDDSITHIRFQNRTGRLHLQGLGWTKEKDTAGSQDSQTHWDLIQNKPSTFSPSSHTHDDRYYTETEVDNLLGGKANSSHEHDRVFITDSRGAARLPSYYNDRYAQWDFQNTADTGAGGDGWHAIQTIAKWASFDPSHKQEQLVFTGGDIKHRVANSDTEWGGYKTLVDSSNVGSYAAPISHTHDDRYYTESEIDTKLASKAPTSHTHDDRYYTEAEVDSITHQWEWRWQRWQSLLTPANGNESSWTNYYKTYFTERTEATDVAYPLEDSGYINTLTGVNDDGGFGGSTYGNMFGNLSSYHALIYTNIYVDQEFTVNVSNFNGDDPHAIFVDGVFVHGNTGCCVDTSYSYTFKTGWHRIDLIYSEGGGGDWIRMGWNPKDYTTYISDMTPHRGGENPRYVLNKINQLGTLATQTWVGDNYQPSGSYAASNHNHTYNVNDSWLRDNGDNANFKIYGNSRQIAFRTDGTSEYSSGVGGYPFVWMYGGDSSGNRRMILHSDGRLWTSNYGWLHDKFADINHNHNSQYLGISAKAADSEAVDGVDSSRIVYGANARRSTRYDGEGIVSPNQNSGFYYGYHPDGAPYAEWWNWLTVAGASWTSGNNYDFKLAHDFHSDRLYVSRMTNGTQYDWREVITSGNIGTQTVASANVALSMQWNNILSKPSSFTPSAHTHGIGDVTGLQAALDAKQPAGSYAGVNGSYSNDFYVDDLYYDSWIRNHSNNNGIYWSNTGWHLYPQDNDDFRLRSGNSGSAAIRFNTGGTDRNYVYNNSSNEIGFLSTSRGWIFKVTNSGTATATGDVVAFSDKRLKENIETIPNALEKVEAMRGVTFTRKDTGKESIGLIAQEVEEVIPEVVNDEGEYKGVAYGNLVGVLIEAVKELSAEVKELKAKLGE